MDYKEKYEIALEGIQEILSSGQDSIKMSRLQLRLQGIFPELKEDEDEKIRKEIISHLLYLAKYCNESMPNVNKWLEWLEKQEHTDSIIEKAKTEKQRIIITETNGDANIDWDTRSLEDVRKLLECGLQYINTEIEKQGESKPADKVEPKGYNSIDPHFGKPIDKVEPKFHEGDWVVQENIGVYKIIEVCESWYEVVDNKDKHYSIGFDKEYMCHLWTIQNAKDGDILVYEGEIFMIKSCVLWNRIVYHCCYDGKILHRHSIYDSWKREDFDKVHPATKEQCDALMKAMTNVGWEFDFEKKELKKIEQKSATMSLDEAIEHCKEKSCGNNACALEHKQLERWLTELKELKEQKPAWSEEDETRLTNIIIMLKEGASHHFIKDDITKAVDWLKPLKERVQPKAELTQLDENILEAAIAFVEQNNHFNYWGGVDKHTVLSALHSLKPKK